MKLLNQKPSVTASTEMNIKKPKEKVEANRISRRLRDTDEGSNKYDIVGIMLRGRDLSIRTLVTYNTINNTFYQNYNTSIVSEEQVVTGTWESLTAVGQVKLRNLTRFWQQKMPDKLRDLRNKLMRPEAPTAERLLEKGFVGMPIAYNDPGHKCFLDHEELIDYDLDNVHLAQEYKVESDIDLTNGDDFIQTHSYIEQALQQAGFGFKLESKSPTRYLYSVTFQGYKLNELDRNDGKEIQGVTDAIRLAVGTLGWEINDATFPLKRQEGLMWTANGERTAIKVETQNSQLEFIKIGA